MKAMIFAAGLGTRLKPLTDTMPKALLPLAGKTLLEWQIDRLRAAGITEIVINIHHLGEQIADYLQQHGNFGCQIRLSDERDRLLETGGGLYKAREFFLQDNEPILVCNVDILSNIDLNRLQAAYRGDMLGLLVVSPRQTQRYLLFDDAMRMHGWTNIATEEIRPAALPNQDKLRPLAFSGMQILSPRIFEQMAPLAQAKEGKFSLIDVYLSLCSEQPLYGYVPADYRMMDVGKIGQLQEAERFAEGLL